MSTSKKLARHFREVHFGPNMTGVSLTDALDGVTWQIATQKIEGFNTIALLTFHINYYIHGVIPVFEGGTLDIRDRYSFDMPEITSEVDWNKLLDQFWSDAKKLASLIEQLPEDGLAQPFVKEAYGNYFRNIMGIIEHTHYHMGQIVIIKKMLTH